MRIKKNSYIKGKGSGDAPFFFAQNFFEKNIFFSRKPLDKIEKVWYNIYTEKENPKGHRKALKELKEPEKEKIMKTINQFITDHSLQNKVTPRGVFPDDEARVVFYNGMEVFLTLSFTSAEEAARIAFAAAQETNFSIYSDRVRFIAVGVRKTSMHYDYLTGVEIKEILA